MSYEEFKSAYIIAFDNMNKYTCDQVGSQVYAEKMADLYDINPDWADQIEEESE